MSRETKVSRAMVPAGIVDGMETVKPSGPLVLEREPDFYWSGHPVFRCRFCGRKYERVANLPAVLGHEAEAHPKIVAVRESRVLGHDGKPLQVAEEE
jgi:hypothetical protein